MFATRSKQGIFGILIVTAVVLVGCRSVPTQEESAARRNLHEVESLLRPFDTGRSLPVLTKDSSLGDYLRFAMLNQPLVEAAYFDWAASIERIVIESALPDPRLSFEADITDIVMTLMPGLMQEFPGPGKLKAAADVATAESRAKYYAFENSVLQAAFALKRAYYQLWFLDENIRINRETLSLLAELEEAARAQNAAGRVTLQDVYRAQIEQDQLITEIENLEDSRRPLTVQLKAALGLSHGQADPPMPTKFDATPLDLDGDALLETAFARNPRLRMLEEEISAAEATIALARKSRVPDFSLGLMTDLKALPMVRPQAAITLPIWREKISAQIAETQASKRAAEARLDAEQIMVTVDFAMKSYEYRDVTRTLSLLQQKLVPKARQSLAAARAGYLAGRVDFFDLLDAERTLLGFQLQEIEARTRREIVLADLSLSIAGIAPEGAPILPVSIETNSSN